MEIVISPAVLQIYLKIMCIIIKHKTASSGPQLCISDKNWIVETKQKFNYFVRSTKDYSFGVLAAKANIGYKLSLANTIYFWGVK